MPKSGAARAGQSARPASRRSRRAYHTIGDTFWRRQSRMSLDIKIPGPPLSQYVAMLWHCQGYVTPHAFERVLPSGTVQLLMPLTDEPLRAYDNRDVGRCAPYRGPLVC